MDVIDKTEVKRMNGMLQFFETYSVFTWGYWCFLGTRRLYPNDPTHIFLWCSSNRDIGDKKKTSVTMKSLTTCCGSRMEFQSLNCQNISLYFYGRGWMMDDQVFNLTCIFYRSVFQHNPILALLTGRCIM